MKLLFIHDHKFYNLNSKIYSPGGLPSKTWDRYLRHFSSITVLGRGENIEVKKKGLVLSDNNNVNFNLFYSIKGGIDYYRYNKLLNSEIEREIERHDVVLLRLPSEISNVAASICISKNKKYFVEVVGCVWDSNWNYSLKTKLVAPVNYYKMKKNVYKAQGAIYVTKFFLQNRYPNNKHTSYASNVNIENFSNILLKNRNERVYSKNKEFKIGLIANLEVKYKGFDVISKVLAQMNDYNIKLYLVGGGRKEYVKKIIDNFGVGEKVEIIGSLKSGEEIYNFIDSLDLYVHPSKQEGLPRVVIEAMSRACPVLSSSIAGVPELLDERFMHKPGRSKELLEQLKKVINNKILLYSMSEANFKRSKDYTIEKLTRRRDVFLNYVKKNIDNE